MTEWDINWQMKRQRRQVPCTPANGRVETLVDILLNKHVMPSPARKWIVKARPQKLTPDAHWTSWLPVFAFNRDKWGPWV